MTKRDFQKTEYDREKLEKDILYVSRRETIEDMKFKSCSSLTKDERFAIRYCLNKTVNQFQSSFYDLELQVDGVDIKQTLLNLLERM